jgi:hypothetical protein
MSGVLEDARGLRSHDHVCWAYDDPAEFRSRAGEFLAEGLTQGQRVCYVGVGATETLAGDLWEVDGMDEALQRGAAQVASVDATYAGGAVIEPEAQVQGYAGATDEALSAGFSGLRVAADVTPLVRHPTHVVAFARFEHLIDRYMAVRPFSAMCGYGRSELGEETIAQVACMHPNTSPGASAFRLYASTREDCSAAIDGELDLATGELFPLALRHADLQPHNGELVLDATELGFIDHRNLIELAEHARERAATAVLRTDRPGPGRVVELLNLQNVRVEPNT